MTNDQQQDLTELAREYFRSTNPADLEAALVAMAARLHELESTVAGLREALGH